MCDYSLHSVKSRAAKAGDKLIIASFPCTYTRGFSASDEPSVAVCLRPGTELAFEADVKWGPPLSMLFRKSQAFGRLVRFCQINTEWMETHHDAIEFPNGQVVLLTSLRRGQKATILQLPASRSMTQPHRSNEFVIDLVPMRTEDSSRSEWFFAG